MELKDVSTRLTSVEIWNFKNVSHGKISFTSCKDSFGASILGLYGQNGSGKTALIEALDILSYSLKGERVPSYYSDMINASCTQARFRFSFEILFDISESKYLVIYEFAIAKAEKENNTAFLAIENETLKFSFKSANEKQIMTTAFTTVNADPFGPNTKLEELVESDKESVIVDLKVARQMAYRESRSFLFSTKLITLLNEKLKKKQSIFLQRTSEVISILSYYGLFELVVVTTKDLASLVNGELKLYILVHNQDMGINGSIMLNTEHSCRVNSKAFPIVKDIIENMNIVLDSLIPGMQVVLNDKGEETGPEGIPAHRVELLSFRNGISIPLHYESEGVKKIIAVLSLLVGVFNIDSLTVAIDELDSGVFEYLLGELLKIISEQGRGQLIFTSHNLRPLETLDKSYIAFTSTDPDNRYVRLHNIMANNNLRNCYYRIIVTGDNDTPLYDYSNNAKLALAFRKAGGAR